MADIGDVLARAEGIGFTHKETLEQPFYLGAELIDEYGDEYDIEIEGNDEDHPLMSDKGADDGKYLADAVVRFGEDGPTVEWEQEYRQTNHGDVYRAEVTVQSEDAALGQELDGLIDASLQEYAWDHNDGFVEELRTDVSGYTWDDVVLPDEIMQRVQKRALGPLQYPEIFERVDMEAPTGVMLEGEPGIGKTLLARVVASEVDANFYEVNANDITSMWYGQSEERMQEVFDHAQEEDGPTILFFDEADTLMQDRDQGFGNDATRRVVNTVLSNMDGMDDIGDVMVFAATNRYDAIDPAAKRPGRFDDCISVPIPDQTAREQILEVHTREGPFADDIDYDRIARKARDYTGSDIDGLVQEAKWQAVLRAGGGDLPADEDDLEGVLEDVQITEQDFEDAFTAQGQNGMDPADRYTH